LLRSLPGVRDAVVVVPPDLTAASEVIAYVTREAEAQVSVLDLRRQLATFLPDRIVPERFAVLDRLPLTATGGYDLDALAACPDSVVGPESGYVTPRTPIEGQLAAIFEQLLGVEQISVHDTFFELNGFSLLATQLASQIRDTFLVSLQLRTIFESPTVAGLAEQIVAAQAELIGEQELAVLLEALE
jgi:hypothetical protein